MVAWLVKWGGKKLAGKAIKSVKIAKDLTKRRADFEDVIKSVDKHKSPTSPKIKYDYAKKISSIHDKYEKKKN